MVVSAARKRRAFAMHIRDGLTPLHALVVGVKRHDARVLAQPPRADDDDDDAGEDDDFGDKAVAKLMLVLMAAAPASLIASAIANFSCGFTFFKYLDMKMKRPWNQFDVITK